MSIMIVKRIEEIGERRCEQIVKEIEVTMRANAPVYTGRVLRSIKIERVGKWRWFIGPHTDHDYWAEYGNHANHPDGLIHAKRGYMRWVTPQGKIVETKTVRPHKGSRFVHKTASKFR